MIDLGSGAATADRLSRRSLLVGGTITAAAAVAGPEVSVVAPAAAAAGDITGVWDVTTFGAVGNFFTDDTVAIQDAVDAALTDGGGIVWIPAGVFRLTKPVSLTGSGTPVFDRPITVQGVGRASIVAIHNGGGKDNVLGGGFAGTGNDAAFAAWGREDTKVPLAADLPIGSRRVTLPSSIAPTVAVGDVIGIEEVITSDFVYPETGCPRDVHSVIAKSGAVVDLDSPTVYGYTAAAKIWRLTTVRSPAVRDLAITSARPADPLREQTVLAIRFQRATDVRVQNVTLTDCCGGIMLHDVVGGHVDHATINRLWRYDDHGGYGVTVAGGTANVSVVGLVGTGTRHLFTTLGDGRGGLGPFGGPRNISVIGGVGEGGGEGAAGAAPLSIWDTHEAGTDIDFVGCSAVGAGVQGTHGFQIRARRVRITDCVAKWNKGAGVSVFRTAANVTVTGGEYAHNTMQGILTQGADTFVSSSVVRDNGAHGIRWDCAGRTVTVQDCLVVDNGVTSGAAALHDGGANDAAKAAMAVVVGNTVPKSTIAGRQPKSVLGVGHASGPGRAVIANNVFLRYGSGNAGFSGVGATAQLQNNVVDP